MKIVVFKLEELYRAEIEGHPEKYAIGGSRYSAIGALVSIYQDELNVEVVYDPKNG